MISKEILVVLVGVLLVALPQFGIPLEWKEYIMYGSGGLLILIGYILRRAAYLRRIDHGNGERGTEAFLESHQTRIDFSTPLE